MSNNESFAAGDAAGAQARRPLEFSKLRLLAIWLVAFLAFVAIPVLVPVPQASGQEVTCEDVTEIEERQLDVALIVNGQNRDVEKRFGFDGLKPGEKVAGFEIVNTNSRRPFTANSGTLLVHKNSGELSDMTSLNYGGYNTAYESFTGVLSDSNAKLTISFAEPKTVASPIGTGKAGRVEMNLRNLDTAKGDYKVVALVQTTRKECTTKTPAPTTADEPSPEPTQTPTPTSEAPSPEPSPGTPTADPAPSTPRTTSTSRETPTSQVDPQPTQTSTPTSGQSEPQPTPSQPEDVCVSSGIPVWNVGASSPGQYGFNHVFVFQFGNFAGTRKLQTVAVNSEVAFKTGGMRFDYRGKSYVAGTDFTVSPAAGDTRSAVLTFSTPVEVTSGNQAVYLYTTLKGQIGAAKPRITVTGSTCYPEELPEVTPPSPDPSPSDDPSEPEEPNVPVEKPTERRPLRPGEQQIVVSARTFVPMFIGGSQDRHTSRGSGDTRLVQGIRFELWETDSDLGDALQKGPRLDGKVREPRAYCVTDATGECNIYVPDSYLGKGKRFYVKQVTNAPGTFHVDKVNWGKYGRADARFEAYLPGPTDLVTPGGRTDSDRTYEVPQDDRLSGDTVHSVNSDLRRDASQWSSFGSAAQSVNNPPLEKARKCQASGGPKIALVMDITASINTNGDLQKYQRAVYGADGFLESLRGTGAEVAMFNFNTASPGRDKNYPDLRSVDSQMDTLKKQAESILRGTSGGTNWEAGLAEVIAAMNAGQKYDEVIFITDGDANGYGKNGGGDFSDGRSGYVRAIEAAIYRSNDIKAAGTRVVSIGVGSAEDAPNWDGSGQLEAISGLKYGVDYFGTDWDRLAATLRAAASQITCQNEIVVDKTLVDEFGRQLVDQRGAAAWNVDIDVDNVISEISWNHGDVPAAVLSPNASTADDSAKPLKIHDRRQTPDSRWFLTFYGNAEAGSKLANRADIKITEDVNSRPGYTFVPGTGRTSRGGYTGRGSWYEIRSLRYDTVLETGPVTDPAMKFPALPQDRKLIVHLQNTPSVAVQKGTAQSVASVGTDNKWVVRYDIRANGTSASRTRIPAITDRPQFPDGFEIQEVFVDGVRRQLVDRQFEVAAAGSRTLSKSDIASYSVEIHGVYNRRDTNGRLVPLATLGDELKCRTDGTDGPGRGLYNEVYMTPDVDGPDNNRACVPIVPNPPKNPTVEKNFVSVEPVADSTTGEQIVTYRIVVKGDPNSDLKFDLVDRTAFAPGIDVDQVQARFLGGSNSGDPGLGRTMKTLEKKTDSAGMYWFVASGTVPARGVFEYEIQFQVKGLDAVKQENRQCKSTGQERFRSWTPQNGFYNQATLGWGEGTSRQTQDVDACGDIKVEPRLKVEKTVAEYPHAVLTNAGQLHDDRSTALQYRIVVTNTGTGPGKYTLRDTPLFANGVEALGDHHRIVSAEAVNASTGERTNLRLPGYTVWVDANGKPQYFDFASDTEIAPNTSHVYTVQIAFGEKSDFFSAKNQQDNVCSSTPGRGRKGLNNEARLDSVKNPAEEDSVVPDEAADYVDYACANVPPQPQIVKDLLNDDLKPDDTVRYNVVVSNPEGGVARRIDVVDNPKFGGNIKVDPKRVTVDGKAVEYVPGKEFKLGTIELQPGESRTFVVEAKYSTTGGETNPDQICASSSYGLNNVAEMRFAYFPDRSEGKRPRLSDKDDACGMVRLDLKLGVQKLVADKNGNETLLDPADGMYEFELKEDSSVAEAIKLSTAEVAIKPGIPYLLTETRAPSGYSLLAEPVRFRVVHGDGGYRVEFFDTVDQKWAQKLTNVSAAPGKDERANVQIISVVDVSTGTLPRTGGVGIGTTAGFASVIIALGYVMLRRRQA